MRIIDARNSGQVDRLVARDASRDPAVLRQARRIVGDVRRRGDAAVRQWNTRFGGEALTAGFDVPRREWTKAAASTPRDVRDAIRLAARNIRRVAERQRPRAFSLQVTPGVRIEQRVEPLSRIGCYVPGGRYPLPSTLLMTVIPAVVAGAREIVVACPRPSPLILAAALEAGATRVLRIGGAQAIAALAYGTDSIARVDKVVGPGNAWVTAAKDLVSRDCATDMRAGPSEIVIWSDRGRADWIAADLLAQAEHDPSARAILVTTSRSLAGMVAAEVRARAPRIGPAREAIRRNGAIVIARRRSEAGALIERLAPEHLVCSTREDAAAIRSAGTVFVGPWSAQAAGDYTTGSNHVLPTGGAARFRGGLSTTDFVRVSTVQTISKRGLRAIGPAAISLAEAEGLSGHAQSIRIRL